MPTYISCNQPALATIEPSRLRVKDPNFWGGAWARPGSFVELATGHDPMVSEPATLVRLLLAHAV
jgi:hypothetical protein